jgi:AraC-like DNA-binding protein
MDVFDKPAFGRHLAPIARRFTASPPVSLVGHLREKTSRVTCPFTSFNYSFVLRGRGTYRYQGQMLTVEAPSVITQSPGQPVDYGPDETWDELFLIYDVQELPHLAESGLVPNHPLWPIQDPGQLQPHLAALVRVLSLPYLDPQIDKVDALCAMLVLESLGGPPIVPGHPEADVIRRSELYLNTHLYDDVNLAALADAHGLRPAAFRRHWMRVVGIPPARYLMQQRIKEACRLLVESPMAVGKIAGLLRFDDPLYFSRKFRLATGLTATEYRRRYRSNLSLSGLDGVSDRAG